MRAVVPALLLALALCGCQPAVSAPRTPYVAPAASQAAQELHGLTTSPGSPAGYRRDLFGQAWTDDYDGPWGHDGCDTRNQVLRRDAVQGSAQPAAGCRVRAGRWVSPYTGQVLTARSQVQVDHIVPLGYAYAHGARDWSTERRVAYANDPANLLAVDGHSNQAKGDRGPSQWKPQQLAAWCPYALAFTDTAYRYRLTVTSDDQAALGQMLGAC